MSKEEFMQKINEIATEYKINNDYNIAKVSTCYGVDLDELATLYVEFEKVPNYSELLHKCSDLKQQLEVSEQKRLNAINYIEEKQKIQYKYALSHIECDELLEILGEDK